MNQPTIGQLILAALLASQLGIRADRALRLYVQGHDIDPSWEEMGKTLLENFVSSASAPGNAGPTPKRESSPPESGNVH
jgi:hypothetical protein